MPRPVTLTARPRGAAAYRLGEEPPVYLGKPSPPSQLVTYLMNHALVSLRALVSRLDIGAYASTQNR